MQPKTNWITSKLVILGGLIHIAMAIGLLFLPVLITGRFGDQFEASYSQSYIQQGGNLLGYTLLLLMILAGITAIYSNTDSNYKRAYIVRWLVVFVSVMIVVIAGF